jgi:SPX domain protein involved in polyphosphate accumulation
MVFDRYCQNGNMYTVNNIYFDTPTFNIIRNSVSKPAYKSKIRMRSYITEAQESDVTFLEMKKKIGGVVNKRRIVGKLIDIETFVNTREKPKHISLQQNQVFNEISYALDVEGSKPAVYLTYKRIALFANNDPTVRVTIDEDILARTTDVSLRSKRYGQEVLPKGYYLMEIKINGAFPLWLSHILTEMNIHPTSFSKYGKFYEYEVKEKISNE